MGSADTFGEAFAKAQLSAGQALPIKGTVFISVIDRYKQESIELAKRFVELGFSLVATHGTADRLEKSGLTVDRVYKVKEGRPNVVDLIKGQSVQLIVNTPHGAEPWFDEKAIRRAAVTNRIPTITTMAAAWAAAEGIAALQRNEVNVRSLQQWHGGKSSRQSAISTK
jgi:carbamoyl-phosphate synthase large subunit